MQGISTFLFYSRTVQAYLNTELMAEAAACGIAVALHRTRP